MKIEIRKTGEQPVCETCGSNELVYSGGNPITADLSGVFEREMLRREIGLARVLRDHLAVAAADQAEAESRMAADLAAERWQLRQDHHTAVTEIETLLHAAKATDIPGWRVARMRRERKFSERIDAVIAALVDSTRFSGQPVTENTNT